MEYIKGKEEFRKLVQVLFSVNMNEQHFLVFLGMKKKWLQT